MPNNTTQSNNANDFISFDEFDFDDDDVLVKDEQGELASLKHDNTKTRRQEDKKTLRHKNPRTITKCRAGAKTPKHKNTEALKQISDFKPSTQPVKQDNAIKDQRTVQEASEKKPGQLVGFFKKVFSGKKKEDAEVKDEPMPQVSFVWIGGEELQDGGEAVNTKTRAPLQDAGQAQKPFSAGSFTNVPEDKELSQLEDTIKPIKPIKPEHAQKDSTQVRKLQDDLLQKARIQNEKAKALSREGEGLVFNEEDEKEIKEAKKHIGVLSYPDVSTLAQKLIIKLKIVTNLKIDLIQRLKNIIDSYLRDIRTEVATGELLQRSVDKGGLGLTPDQAAQIIKVIKGEYNKLHIIPTPQTSFAQKAVLQRVPAPTQIKTVKKEGTGEIISKKIARDAQIGIFSDEIKTQKQDKLLAWEEQLSIPQKLRTPEISAPPITKKIISGGPALAQNPSQADKADEVDKEGAFKIFETKEPELNKVEPVPVVIKDREVKEEAKKPKISIWSKLFQKNKKKDIIKEYSLKKILRKEVASSAAPSRPETEPKIPVPPTSAETTAGKATPAPPQQAVSPRVFRTQQRVDQRPRIEDVKVVQPRLVGPVEELSEMTLADFRRLGPTPQDSIDKIKEKIHIADQDSFSQKVACINAWRKSQPNQLYLELGRQSLLQRVPVADLIGRYKLEKKSSLTKEEFDLINHLNKELRY
jgi:hypothetical protein